MNSETREEVESDPCQSVAWQLTHFMVRIILLSQSQLEYRVMKCAKCQFENPAGLLYCGKCGTKLFPTEDIPASPTKRLHVPMRQLARGGIFAS